MGYPARKYNNWTSKATTMNSDRFANLQDFLSHCVAAVRESGSFVSKQVAGDRGLVSTAEAARDRIFAGIPFTVEDAATATQVAAWAANQNDANNDFLQNLSKSIHYASRDGVTHRNFSMVAAAVTAFERGTNQRIGKATYTASKNAVDCDASRIVELFRTAYENGAKRRPKIVLEANAAPVMFAPAPASGRNAGCIYVSNGQTESANVYYGKITPDGKFEPSKACTDAIRDLVVSLAKDPVGVARAYGLATKYCCFCDAELTAGESQAVGYGPICAAKFNLPWGEVKVDTKVVIDLPLNK